MTATNKNNAKLGKGVGEWSHDLLIEFWDRLYISGTVEARIFKFGTHIDHEGH